MPDFSFIRLLVPQTFELNPGPVHEHTVNFTHGLRVLSWTWILSFMQILALDSELQVLSSLSFTLQELVWIQQSLFPDNIFGRLDSTEYFDISFIREYKGVQAEEEEEEKYEWKQDGSMNILFGYFFALCWQSPESDLK